jgi:hypothetical protein
VSVREETVSKDIKSNFINILSTMNIFHLKAMSHDQLGCFTGHTKNYLKIFYSLSLIKIMAGL